MGSLLEVEELPVGFMRGCARVTSVQLPPRVGSFGRGAFQECPRLVMNSQWPPLCQ